jgi:hypothetical protein
MRDRMCNPQGSKAGLNHLNDFLPCLIVLRKMKCRKIKDGGERGIGCNVYEQSTHG